MTPDKKKEFIEGLVASVRNEIVDKVKHMPDHWDGHELRRYIADKFDESASWPAIGTTEHWKRRKEYRESILIRNL